MALSFPTDTVFAVAVSHLDVVKQAITLEQMHREKDLHTCGVDLILQRLHFAHLQYSLKVDEAD